VSNSAGGSGGGMYVDTGEVTLNSGRISGNAGYGESAVSANTGDVTIHDGEISNNTTLPGGAAVIFLDSAAP
jgi:hypothetical protein